MKYEEYIGKYVYLVFDEGYNDIQENAYYGKLIEVGEWMCVDTLMPTYTFEDAYSVRSDDGITIKMNDDGTPCMGERDKLCEPVLIYGTCNDRITLCLTSKEATDAYVHLCERNIERQLNIFSFIDSPETLLNYIMHIEPDDITAIEYEALKRLIKTILNVDIHTSYDSFISDGYND